VGSGSAAAGVPSELARASPVEITECFQTVEVDSVLAHDLVCEVRGLQRAAIEIVSSDVTIDLDGHALFGYPVGDLGIRAEGVDRVTVKNGTIDGFTIGLTFAEGADAIAEDLTIRNLESGDPDEWVIGVWINDSEDAVVRNADFEFLPSAHKSAVEAWNTGFTVDSITLNGGALGVEINFSAYGSVVNSRFLGATIAGILIEGSDGARLTDNEFVRNEAGIAAAGPVGDPISGLIVEGNSIKQGFVGVRFKGISESTIQDNLVRSNGQGIFLEPNHCQDPPGPECQFSTGNVIMGNTVIDNGMDLYHHETCAPNTWKDNLCRTKDGDEIPRCSRQPRRPGRRVGSARP